MAVLPISLVFFLFLFLFFFTPFSLCLTQDGLFLLSFKSSLTDPLNSLSLWNPLSPSPCSWPGVLCNSSSAAPPYVVSLNLSSAGLSGPFSTTSLCRIPHLSSLVLTDNSLGSGLPNLSLCYSLRYLDLSLNLFTGVVVAEYLPRSLEVLILDGNNFTGPIPASLPRRVPRLETLSLVNNLLGGTIPPELGLFGDLVGLRLAYNPFDSGSLPAEIGNLTKLEELWATNCNLVGEIPDEIGKLGSLKNLDLSNNGLVGRIPAVITRLKNVVQVELYNNSLTGEIPKEMGNMTMLVKFDASRNLLTGEIPSSLCALSLESLNLYSNLLTGGLPEDITRSRSLYELKLFNNRLSGLLPADLGKNSPFAMLDLSFNEFSGELPAGICNGGVLTDLLLLNNSLRGPIPASYGKCQSLTRVRLSGNLLSGEVPASLWGSPSVSLLELSDNHLNGSISTAIGNAGNLSKLIISNNMIGGEIPVEISQLTNLVDFSGDRNAFTGSLPTGLFSLYSLANVHLQHNQLTGEIPAALDSAKQLNDLNLADNLLSGSIPPELGDLPSLNYLDLSDNSLTGSIPAEFQSLKLNLLNLSNNQLSGSLPSFFNNKIYFRSFLGNPQLCSADNSKEFLIESCSTLQHDQKPKDNFFSWLLRLVFVIAALVFIVGVVLFYWRYRNYKRSEKAVAAEKAKWTLTSFHKLCFNELEVLDSLDEDSLIGCGSSGKVYKAVLSSGEAVAVKKLWTQGKDDAEAGSYESDKGFEAEIATLGKIRHKNIVKLWCSCSNNETKLLVYEYMPNGSLSDLLHNSKAGLLDWPTRYRIAVDSAEGLSYLHHDCVPPVVHRDVKSSNILLDADFRARVADFGVAKTLEQTSGRKLESMSVIAGSLGYIAPEYAYTLRVNEKSDIYSFGVVILELVTGKSPVNIEEFGECKTLVKWVTTCVLNKGAEYVLDSRLLGEKNGSGNFVKDEMCKILDIGILCTSSLPINRPSMRKVVKMLLEVGVGMDERTKSIKKDGKLSPYYYYYGEGDEEEQRSDNGNGVGRENNV